jgi:hypothetical protein
MELTSAAPAKPRKRIHSVIEKKDPSAAHQVDEGQGVDGEALVMVLFYVIGNCRRLGSRWRSARRLPVMGA